MLVGAYTLKRLEMSQQIDSNSRVFPTMRWSLYEQSELLDTLMIHDNFEFNRKVNFRQFHNQTSTGQFVVQQDSFLTLSVLKGQLYTIPKLNIETITNDELVIIERFKTRWIRRTFQKTSP
ncbi:MAG: hypothetical protein JNL70_12710 [Saprospiraceae bacterium]|nr:hypothetical protein [Saprospiraceae bacterium]